MSSTYNNSDDDERALEEMVQRAWEAERQKEAEWESEVTGKPLVEQALTAYEGEEEEQDFSEMVHKAWRDEAQAEKKWEAAVLSEQRKQVEDGDVQDAAAEAAPVQPPVIKALPVVKPIERNPLPESEELEPPTKKKTIDSIPVVIKAPEVKHKEVRLQEVPSAVSKPVFTSRGLYTSLGAADHAKRERARQQAAASFMKNELIPWMKAEHERVQIIQQNENAKVEAFIRAREEQFRAQRLARDAKFVEMRKQAIVDFEEAEKVRVAEIAKKTAEVRQRIADFDARRRENEARRKDMSALLSHAF